MTLPDIELSTGLSISPVGYGGGGRVRDAEVFRTAIEVGYRLVDTAEMYKNDHLILKGTSTEVAREVRIVTKILPGDPLPATIDRALERIGRDNLDVVLLHFPVNVRKRGGHVERLQRTWRGLERLVHQGKVRALGVSNTGEGMLSLLLGLAEIPPVLNQIEHHPYMQQWPLIDFCRAESIRCQAYCPLGAPHRRGDSERQAPLDHPTIREIASTHGRTPAQIILRWHVQKGVVPIPSTLSRERMHENLQVKGFELAPSEVERIDALDRQERIAGGLLPTVVGLHGIVRKSKVRLGGEAARRWGVSPWTRLRFNLGF